MIYQFLIQGSAVDPYLVEFSCTKQKFKAECTCPAGYKKQLCKHITSFLEGEIPLGIKSGDINKIPNIVNAFRESEISTVYDLYLSIFKDIETQKKEMVTRRKQIARLLYK